MILPDYIKNIIRVYEDNGYLCYVVGGAVRDSLLLKEPSDYDLATNALPCVSMKMFGKTIDTGLKHGTITIITNEHAVEVTTFRIDGDYKDNRHPDNVTFTADVKEDLKRRDFTINSIAYNPKEGYVDFFDGVGDIRRKIVKAVGDPMKRFSEDGLRMIRAIRFSAKLEFSIEDKTWQAIIDSNYLIQNISKERVKDELDKILMSPKRGYIKHLYDTGLINYLDTPYLCYENKKMDKAMRALSRYTGGSLSVCYTLWFMYVPHERLKEMMRTLKFDNRTLNDILLYHEQMYADYIASEYHIRKMLCESGYEALLNILEIKAVLEDDLHIKEFTDLIDDIVRRGDPITLRQLAVKGEDLKEYGFLGEQIGKCLNILLDMVHKDPSLNEKAKLIDIVCHFQAKGLD